MARVIGICNAKGGVGKTTTAVNLAAFLAHFGRRVLLVDFDPQANASSAVGYDLLSDEPGIYHGILGAAAPEALTKKSQIPGLNYISSHQNLAGALVELITLPEREHFLRKFLTSIRHDYDYIVIDLPPSLSLLTVNGLVASDEVIIPVQAEYYSLEGLSQLLQVIALIKKNLRHPLKIAGAVLTMFDSRERLARDVAMELQKNFSHRIFNIKIPRTSELAEAPSFGKPVLLYAPDSLGAYAYRRLTEEVITDEALFQIPPHFGNFSV
ncbi:MAG: ParA family protein [bacterium]|nr:ParA family protein [bacterium]